MNVRSIIDFELYPGKEIKKGVEFTIDRSSGAELIKEKKVIPIGGYTQDIQRVKEALNEEE